MGYFIFILHFFYALIYKVSVYSLKRFNAACVPRCCCECNAWENELQQNRIDQYDYFYFIFLTFKLRGAARCLRSAPRKRFVGWLMAAIRMTAQNCNCSFFLLLSRVEPSICTLAALSFLWCPFEMAVAFQMDDIIVCFIVMPNRDLGRICICPSSLRTFHPPHLYCIWYKTITFQSLKIALWARIRLPVSGGIVFLKKSLPVYRPSLHVGMLFALRMSLGPRCAALGTA